MDQCQTTGSVLMGYQCQPETSSYSIKQCQTTGGVLMGYQCQPETSSYSIKAKPNGAILSAIDVNTTLASN